MTDDAALREKLQDLSDRAEILDCMHRYARGMDRHDRDLLRSAYHDDAVDDHAGFVGPVEEFIDWAFGYHAQQARHQHYLMNHTAELHGDEAHAETYYLFVGSDRDAERPLSVTGGRYVDRLERRGGRWGIVARVCLVEWITESTALLEKPALEFLGAIQRVAQDRSDQSYDRPLVVARAKSSDS